MEVFARTLIISCSAMPSMLASFGNSAAEILLLHEYSNLRVFHNLNLYDKLNDMLILIVSYIWSIGGQTHRWRHHLLKEIDSRLPCIMSVTNHRWRQNVLITLVSDWPAPRVPYLCTYHTLTSTVIYCWTDRRTAAWNLLPNWRILWKYIPV